MIRVKEIMTEDNYPESLVDLVKWFTAQRVDANQEPHERWRVERAVGEDVSFTVTMELEDIDNFDDDIGEDGNGEMIPGFRVTISRFDKQTGHDTLYDIVCGDDGDAIEVNSYGQLIDLEEGADQVNEFIETWNRALFGSATL